jgi:hypothetical protein
MWLVVMVVVLRLPSMVVVLLQRLLQLKLMVVEMLPLLPLLVWMALFLCLPM